MNAGKLHPLENAPDFTEKELAELTRCISVIGAEPYIKAIEEGAQVIIAGRSSDTAIYAAVPKYYGLDNGFAWHAGKVLECGTLSTVFETATVVFWHGFAMPRSASSRVIRKWQFRRCLSFRTRCMRTPIRSVWWNRGV